MARGDMAGVEFQELTAKYTLHNTMELRTKRVCVGGHRFDWLPDFSVSRKASRQM